MNFCIAVELMLAPPLVLGVYKTEAAAKADLKEHRKLHKTAAVYRLPEYTVELDNDEDE